jgi:hypothetical protein
METWKSNTMRGYTATVTPAMAEAMLATSVGNRPLRHGWVRELDDAMRRGEWKLTHQGVAFDTNGHLRDGHHRLTAIVKSGRPAAVWVVLGVDAAAVDAMDRGRGRTVSDAMMIDKRIAEPLRLAATIYFRNTQPSIAQVRHVAESGMQDEVERLVAAAPAIRRFFSSAPVKLGAATIILRDGEVCAPFVLGQYRALVTLDFDAMTEASKIFVRKFEGGRLSGTQSRAVLLCALRVFDRRAAGKSKLVVTADGIEWAMTEVRNTVAAALDEEPDNRPREGVIGERVSATRRKKREQMFADHDARD